MEHMYLRADEIRPGDRIPLVSRSTVAAVVRGKSRHSSNVIRIQFANGFIRDAHYGGPEYGFECFSVERAL